ncbi:MAG: DNA gyrase inhibitor YacG [Nitrospirota bacterium]
MRKIKILNNQISITKYSMKITCPTCKNTTTWEENPWRPFCSERCKLIDLGKWASEEYRIAGGKAEEDQKQRTESNAQKAKEASNGNSYDTRIGDVKR